MPVAGAVGVGDEGDAAAVGPGPGQRDDERGIGILRKARRRLARAAAEEGHRGGQPVEVAERLGLGPDPGARRLDDAVLDLLEPHPPRRRQRVDAAERPRRKDHLRAAGGGGPGQAAEQRRLGAGRGGGDREIHPGLESGHPPGGHRRAAGGLDHQPGADARQFRGVGQDRQPPRQLPGQLPGHLRPPGAARAQTDGRDPAGRAAFGQQPQDRPADGAAADADRPVRPDHSRTRPAGGSLPGCSAPQAGQVRRASSA